MAETRYELLRTFRYYDVHKVSAYVRVHGEEASVVEEDSDLSGKPNFEALDEPKFKEDYHNFLIEQARELFWAEGEKDYAWEGDLEWDLKNDTLGFPNGCQCNNPSFSM